MRELAQSEPPERSIAAGGAIAAAVIGGALIVGFYAAFTTNRLSFWTWFAALAVLLPADRILGSATGILNVRRMEAFYGGAGLTHPRSRARALVTFARLFIPCAVAIIVTQQNWAAVFSLCGTHPLVPVAALLAAAIFAPSYVRM
jgi:hypothetical protein